MLPTLDQIKYYVDNKSDNILGVYFTGMNKFRLAPIK